MVLLVCITTLQAQQLPQYWHFGTGAGLKFSDTNTQIIASKLNTDEGTASVTDATGKLIAYTDGLVIYDKNNELIYGGYGLQGANSSTQSVLVIERPSRAGFYYVFTTGAGETNFNDGLCYSSFDANLPPTGRVIEKNIKLLPSVAEKITAIKHPNGQDCWVLAHEWNSNRFVAYLVTANGISEQPVFSSVGTVHTGGLNNKNAIGQLKISPIGNKLALAIAGKGFELFNFDNQTGKVSNPIFLPADTTPCYGVEFSPDGSRLYGSVMSFPGRIYQWDVTKPDSSLVRNSRRPVAKLFTTTTMALQLTPFGTIAVAQYNKQQLGQISNPNLLAPDCNYTDKGILLGKGKCKLGLPNFSADVFRPKPPIMVTDSCANEWITVSTTDSPFPDSLRWICDMPSAKMEVLNRKVKILFEKEGKYKLKLIRNINGYTDVNTTIIEVRPRPRFSLPPDTFLCKPDTILLSVNPNYKTTYLWNDGFIGHQRKVSEDKSYILTANSGGCSFSDTFNLVYPFGTQNKLFNHTDTSFCEGQIYVANPISNKYVQFKWSDGHQSIPRSINQSGVYVLNATAGICTLTDSVRVMVKPLPKFSLGPDTLICGTKPYALKPNLDNAKLIWSDGSSARQLLVTYPDLYWLTAHYNGCTFSDSVKVGFVRPPEFYLPADTSICNGNSIKISARFSNSELEGKCNFLWNNNKAENEIDVSAEGQYTLTASVNGCSNSRTIQVFTKSTPNIYLPADTSTCNPNGLTLNLPANKYDKIIWPDGSSSHKYNVAKSATINVNAEKDGCSVTRTCKVTISPQPTIELPDTLWVCKGVNDRIALGAGTYYNGLNTDTFLVTQSTTLNIERKNLGCLASKSVMVNYSKSPKISFNISDTIACNGDTVVLKPTVSDAEKWQWTDMADKATNRVVTQTSQFEILAENNFCISNKKIRIDFDACESDIEVPKLVILEDGALNTFFTVKGLKEYKWRLYILDLNGIELYRSEQYKNDWDLSGIPSGTYKYTLINTAFVRVYNGTFKLVNNLTKQ